MIRSGAGIATRFRTCVGPLARQVGRVSLRLLLAVPVALAAFPYAARADGPVMPELDWARQFGVLAPASDYATAVDTDGNVYIAGETGGTFPGVSRAGGTYEMFVR